MVDGIAVNFRKMARKFFSGVLVFGLIRLKGLIYIPLLTYFLEKGTVGDIGFLNSLATLVVPLVLLNMPDSCNRIVLRRVEQNLSVDDIYDTIRVVSLLSFLLVAFVAICAGYFLLETMDFAFYLVLMASTRAIQKLYVYDKEIFQRSKELVIYNAFYEYGPLIPVFIYVGGFYTGDLYPIGLITLAVVLMISGAETKKIVKIRFSKFNKAAFVSVISVSFYLMPALYSQLMMQTSDLIFVKTLLGSESAGDYVVSNSLASILLIVSSGISYFWYSSVNYIPKATLRRVVRLIPLVLPVAGVACYYGMKLFIFLVQLYVWQDYNLSLVAPLLAVFYLMMAFVQILSGIMYSQSYDRHILAGSLLSIISNLGLGYVMISNIGLEGAAYSSLISASLLILYFAIVVGNGKAFKEEN